MVQVQSNIHFSQEENRLKIECNLLKREDASQLEWEIAKALEALAKEALKFYGSKLEENKIATMTIREI